MREMMQRLLEQARQDAGTDAAVQAALPHLDAMARCAAGETVVLADLALAARKLSRTLLFEYELLRTPLGVRLQDLCQAVLLLDALARCSEQCREYLASHPESVELLELWEHLAQLQRVVQRDVLPPPRTFLAFDRLIWRAISQVHFALPHLLEGEAWDELRLAMGSMAERCRLASGGN